MTPLVETLADLDPAKAARAIRAASDRAVLGAARDFTNWAHDGQRPPPGDWRCWVLMGGRGYGKTRAGAEWIAARVRARDDAEPRKLRIALVAATRDEARRVMVEGESGLLATGADVIDDWLPSLWTLRLRGGGEATLFSGASPEMLRGPQHHFAWCDELAKWRHPSNTWNMLQLGLRLGDRPRALITTTPRPRPVLRRIMAEPGTVVTGGPTRDNVHLPEAYLSAVEALYAGTRLERQELRGELLFDSPDALWTIELIERCRILPGTGRGTAEGGGGAPSECARYPGAPPPPASRAVPLPLGGRIVIGVDPPAGDGTCGIVACARDEAGKAYVLADHSVTARSPEGWARAVADAAAIHHADRVVAERNQGGRMVEAVLHAADANLPLKLVNATEGKAARAEPVALLFEANKVRLAGRFPELEAELLALRAGGGYEPGPRAAPSPDRADAMVWALTELMLTPRAEPRVLLI